MFSSNRWDYYQHYLDVCFELLEERLNKQKRGLDNGNDDDNHEEDEKSSKNNVAKCKYSILDECHDFFCQVGLQSS